MMNSKHPGFTLLEVMAAMAILSIAMVVLIQSQTQSINNVRNMDDYARAVFITENQLHWTFLDLNEAESWMEYGNQSGEDGDFDWHVTVEAADMERQADTQAVMLRIVATTSWKQGNHDDQFSLETWYLWGQEK